VDQHLKLHSGKLSNIRLGQKWLNKTRAQAHNNNVVINNAVKSFIAQTKNQQQADPALFKR
jgi:hypothetical protein